MGETRTARRKGGFRIEEGGGMEGMTNEAGRRKGGKKVGGKENGRMGGRKGKENIPE